jgi:hypothetical protein
MEAEPGKERQLEAEKEWGIQWDRGKSDSVEVKDSEASMRCKEGSN